MKNFYELTPEVPGHLGENTILDNSVHPPIVKKLDFVFDGWLGDDIIECFPCFLVSENLKNDLEHSKLNGYEIMSCTLSVSNLFMQLHPNLHLPLFYWFKITESKELADFWISDKNNLIVSEDALKILKSYNFHKDNYKPYLRIV